MPSQLQSPTPLISLRPVSQLDRARIMRWLREPEIQRWWGNAAAAEAEIRLALDSTSAISRMIMAGEGAGAAAVGYAQAIDIGLVTPTPPPELPAGTWDVDLFVANAEDRGKGWGEAALALLVDEVFTTTLAPAVCVLVPVRNEPAVRAYEAAGFRWISVANDPILGPSWTLLKERRG